MELGKCMREGPLRITMDHSRIRWCGSIRTERKISPSGLQQASTTRCSKSCRLEMGPEMYMSEASSHNISSSQEGGSYVLHPPEPSSVEHFLFIQSIRQVYARDFQSVTKENRLSSFQNSK